MGTEETPDWQPVIQGENADAFYAFSDGWPAGEPLDYMLDMGTKVAPYTMGFSNYFKVGDFVMADEGGKAYAITSITTTEKTHDTIKVGTTLGVKIEKGGFIIEAAAESAEKTSKLKYTPLSLVGTGKPIAQNSNLDTDGWLIGVTKGNPLPECVMKHLKGIINY